MSGILVLGVLAARGFLVPVDGRTVFRRLAEVARPAAWPIVVLEAAVEEAWRMVEGLVGAGTGFLERGAMEGALAVVVERGFLAFVRAIAVGLFDWDRAVAALWEVRVEGPFEICTFWETVLASSSGSREAIVFLYFSSASFLAILLAIHSVP